MQIKSKTQFQTFNDGICCIYTQGNIAQKGNMPVKGLKKKAPRVPFEKRKVGIRRFYDAKQENAEIELLLRIPAGFAVSTQDICMIGDLQYGIYQVQDIQDTMPQSKDISLKRLEEKYELAGV